MAVHCGCSIGSSCKLPPMRHACNMFLNQLPPPSASVHSTPDISRPPLTWSNHSMTETPKPGLTLRPLVVAILPGHSYSGYHTPQACFKRASSSPHSRPRTWLITSNSTTYDLRSSVHFCNQRTPLVATQLTFRGISFHSRIRLNCGSAWPPRSR